MKESNIIFGELTFDKPGSYHYTVKELTPSGGGWITDKKVYRVIINVTKESEGKLAASAEYPDGWPVFINKFSRCYCQCCEKLFCIILGYCLFSST